MVGCNFLSWSIERSIFCGDKNSEFLSIDLWRPLCIICSVDCISFEEGICCERFFHEGKKLQLLSIFCEVIGKESIILWVFPTIGIIYGFQNIRSNISLVSYRYTTRLYLDVVIRQWKRFRCCVGLKRVGEFGELGVSIAVSRSSKVARITYKSYGREYTNYRNNDYELNKGEGRDTSRCSVDQIFHGILLDVKVPPKEAALKQAS